MGITISDADVARRYEAHDQGDLVGFLDYVLIPDRIVLVHTEVPPEFAGHGIAAQLARCALDDARRRGLRVIASCPYVRAYIERHPETRDIVEDVTPA